MKKILERFKVLAGFHPYLVLTAFVLVALILIAIAYFWGQWTQPSEINQCIGQSITQLISAIFFIFILWHSGWLQSTGFKRFGRGKTWIAAVIILVYMVAVNIYLVTGDFFFELADPHLIFWLSLSSLVAGLFEETAFRGILLFILLRLWSRSKYTVTKSISVTALLFGCVSVLRTDGNSLSQTLLSLFTAAIAGFFYAVILLHGKSIWIPIVLHGLHNVGVNLSLVGKNAVETPQTSLFILLAYIPVFLSGIYMLIKAPSKREKFTGIRRENF